MKVAKASDISQRYSFLDSIFHRKPTLRTKDGNIVHPRAAQLAASFQEAQSTLARIQRLLDVVFCEVFHNLTEAIWAVVPEEERNENNPIWKNYLELEKIFQECTLVDKFKLGDALKSCDQLKDVLDPEIDLYYGNFIIASKGKKMMNGFPQVKT